MADSKSAHASGPPMPSDPLRVLVASCGPEMGPLECQCLADGLVSALERGPHILLGFLELPGATWEAALEGLDTPSRAKAASIRTDVEDKCRRRLHRKESKTVALGGPHADHASRQRTRQVVLNQCIAVGNERAACDCFATTVLDTLDPKALAALAGDARFPPALEGLTPAEKRMALASIGMARTVCGVK